MFLLVLFVLFVLILLVLPVLLIRFLPALRADPSEQFGNTLLVIAHPDDECLFFSPTLLSLRQSTYLLCLSNGSNQRSEELRRSAGHLRIKDLQIIDDPIYLQDSQTVDWAAEAILGHVQRAIRLWKISTVISFDQGGVSGHRNHSAIYFALLRLPRPSAVQFLSLDSVPIYRKYFASLDLLLVWFFFSSADERRRTFLLPSTECFTAHRAMFEHRSQLVWFRYLYVLFSRYIWINQFSRVF